MTMSDPPAIRHARPDEADALTGIARRSKAHWGYPAEFLSRVAPDLTVTVTDIEDHVVRVLETPDGDLLGFCHLIPGDPAVLEGLWLEPTSIGRGLGTPLWRDALAIARASGATAVELDADPNAVGFYERMGAIRIGWTSSPAEAGRTLPRTRIALDDRDPLERAPAIARSGSAAR
jgi:GNAT superfamily N-acetyltransferase